MSTFNTSRSNVNGDVRDETIDHYESLTSSARDKSTFTSSNDCEIPFDELRNIVEISLVNFEIPHTRYAIDSTNNTLYISEKMSDGVYNFFGLKASTGGYTISNLAVNLELSQYTPTVYNDNTVLMNTYNILTAISFRKVAIISSGDYEYNIHTCRESLQIIEFTKVSDTEATVKFIAPFEYIVAPGALLTLNLYSLADREVQIIENVSPREVTIIGDFSDFVDSDVDLEKSLMIPYSSIYSVSEVAGFGIVDLEISRNTSYEVLGIESPFAAGFEAGVSTPMVQVTFPVFISTDDNVFISGGSGIMSGVNARIGTTHDDTHFEVDIDVNTLFAGSSVQATVGSDTFDVSEIEVVSSLNNEVTIEVTTSSAVSFSVGDVVTLSGLTSSEWESDVVITVSSVEVSTLTFGATFTYPSNLSALDGPTIITPSNADTGLPTTYLSPNRFDLSRGRRVILCRATIDGKDLGTIHIPNDRTVYFERIQLFSGADLVNFLSVDQAIGHHKFHSVVKKLNNIRFRFYNEDGTPYDFVGVDYTTFLKFVTLDSNTGI